MQQFKSLKPEPFADSALQSINPFVSETDTPSRSMECTVGRKDSFDDLIKQVLDQHQDKGFDEGFRHDILPSQVLRGVSSEKRPEETGIKIKHDWRRPKPSKASFRGHSASSTRSTLNAKWGRCDHSRSNDILKIQDIGMPRSSDVSFLSTQTTYYRQKGICRTPGKASWKKQIFLETGFTVYRTRSPESDGFDPSCSLKQLRSSPSSTLHYPQTEDSASKHGDETNKLFTVSSPKNSLMKALYPIRYEDRKSPIALTLTSYPFRIIYASKALQRLHNGNADAVWGKGFYDVFCIDPSITPGLRIPAIGTTAEPRSTTDAIVDRRWRCEVEVCGVMSKGKDDEDDYLPHSPPRASRCNRLLYYSAKVHRIMPWYPQPDP